MNDAEFERLTRQLGRLMHLDLAAYKPQQMRRRVGTFVSRHDGDADFDGFLRRLEHEPELLQALRDMVTINVTEFFRDPVQWDVLARTVLPALLHDRPALQIWSAGCSYGQEPLSLAIALERSAALPSARILATDFDQAVLARARRGGVYRDDELAGIPARDRDTYFTRVDNGFNARADLLARIRYKELNLLEDRFETGFDLIACRNVMIYFEPAVRSQLLQRFSDSLRPGGVLFIGATEALLGRDAEGFERVAGNFYRRAVRSRLAA